MISSNEGEVEGAEVQTLAVFGATLKDQSSPRSPPQEFHQRPLLHLHHNSTSFFDSHVTLRGTYCSSGDPNNLPAHIKEKSELDSYVV